MVRINVFILPYLVGQPEDFEKAVQISQAGDYLLISRVDEANHRVKIFQSEGNNTFLNQKRQYSFISFRELFPTVDLFVFYIS
jgi:TRAP-type C4-dicarboxylate transport system substrate-binding protein